MKKVLSLLLATLVLLSMFSLVSCDEETISDVADIALEIIEAIPDDTNTAQESVAPDVTNESGPPASSAIDTSDDTTDTATADTTDIADTAEIEEIDKNGSYDDKDSVALYIHTYGKLPQNYISKAEAEKLGWSGGSVEKFAEGKCIGGAKFGNYEGLLPKKEGRQYYECDIDTLGKDSRGAKRIVYSNDGLIYYTDDHYESFELLFGEE